MLLKACSNQVGESTGLGIYCSVGSVSFLESCLSRFLKTVCLDVSEDSGRVDLREVTQFDFLRAVIGDIQHNVSVVLSARKVKANVKMSCMFILPASVIPS